jgi:hypothetical protein
VGLLRSREGGGELPLRIKLKAPVVGSGAGHDLVVSGVGEGTAPKLAFSPRTNRISALRKPETPQSPIILPFTLASAIWEQ